jgi:hypothetical protein
MLKSPPDAVPPTPPEISDVVNVAFPPPPPLAVTVVNPEPENELLPPVFPLL